MTGNDVTYTYDNAGRLNEVLDGSGRQRLTYDALGNVTAEERTLAIPGNPYSYTFNMGYRHDSWGRMLGMTYPDGEEVTYDYLWGGDLETMTGVKESANHTYISNIQYNAFGQRCVVAYGNGTSASYSYDALHRLTTLTSVSSLGTMQQIDYTHDNNGNILSAHNSAGPVNGLGGTYSNTYIYDKINRLTQSENANNYYALEMRYTSSGRINHKAVRANVTYHVFDSLFYGYCDGIQPHTPKRIYEKNRNILNDLIWDNAGNLGQINIINRNVLDGCRFLFWTADKWSGDWHLSRINSHKLLNLYNRQGRAKRGPVVNH